uniref:Uncharacterized protein n=1 Tax=Musa acuminata subsp. malaccensis TaxID=214687 RepID=A0A804KGE4_MUSAM
MSMSALLSFFFFFWLGVLPKVNFGLGIRISYNFNRW